MADTLAREAVGVFHDEKSMRAAVDELLMKGFDRSAFSLMAGHRTVEQRMGHLYQKVSEIEEDPTIPRQAYAAGDSRTEAQGVVAGGLAYVGAIAAMGAVVMSGGTLAIAVTAAALALGAGGVIGAVLGKLIDRRHADYLQKQLDAGGLLLWVRTADAERERIAIEVLRRHSAEDVHAHELPATAYATEGGMSYDLSFMKRLGM